MFFSIFRWIILAAIIGSVVGVVVGFFLNLLDISIAQTQKIPWYFFALPLVMAFNIWVTKRFAPDSAGHGTEKVIEAIHKDNSNIRGRVVPFKMLSTILTIAAGGSAGKEGPSAHIGGTMGSVLANLFKLSPEDRKKFVICGISAGFSAVFGTPIAGAIFGVEVLFVGTLLYEVLMPSFVAGMAGYQVAAMMGVTHESTHIVTVPDFGIFFFFKIIMAGFLFGGCALVFIEAMKVCKNIAKKIPGPSVLTGIVGGLAIIAITLVLSDAYLGLGIPMIYDALAGDSVPWYAFLAKMATTGITLNFGGGGGSVTTIFFVGATAGNTFANVFHQDPVLYAALGFVSVLAGATNTPLAASIMAVELFGSAIAPYAAVACVISFLMTGYRSAYESQVLNMKKSTSFYASSGQDMDNQETHFEYKTRRRLAQGRRVRRTIMTPATKPLGFLKMMITYVLMPKLRLYLARFRKKG